MSKVTYKEVRFVIEDELTQAYVFMECDDFGLVHGWHHKTFPASVSVLDIMRAWNECKEDPMMWPRKAP